MHRLTLPLVALVAGSLMLGSLASPASAKDAKTRVLLQWTEADTMGQFVMTKHANNLLDDLGQDNVELEILAYGMATLAVTKTRPQSFHADDIQKLTARGVKFRVCHHAMDLLNVKDDELLSTVTPVKGAMYEIVTKYHEGWQTLRP